VLDDVGQLVGDQRRRRIAVGEHDVLAARGGVGVDRGHLAGAIDERADAAEVDAEEVLHRRAVRDLAGAGRGRAIEDRVGGGAGVGVARTIGAAGSAAERRPRLQAHRQRAAAWRDRR